MLRSSSPAEQGFYEYAAGVQVKDLPNIVGAETVGRDRLDLSPTPEEPFCTAILRAIVGSTKKPISGIALAAYPAVLDDILEGGSTRSLD